MITKLIPTVTLFAALGCGLMAGLFFTFSTFLMTALGRLPTAQGIKAMQTINVVILNPVFGLLFAGTTLLCLFLVVAFPFTTHQPYTGQRSIGAVLFLGGVILVTILVNIPLNDALAEVDPGSVAGSKLWARYLSVWTLWNHVRTLSAVGATVSLMLALR